MDLPSQTPQALPKVSHLEDSQNFRRDRHKTSTSSQTSPISNIFLKDPVIVSSCPENDQSTPNFHPALSPFTNKKTDHHNRPISESHQLNQNDSNTENFDEKKEKLSQVFNNSSSSPRALLKSNKSAVQKSATPPTLAIPELIKQIRHRQEDEALRFQKSCFGGFKYSLQTVHKGFVGIEGSIVYSQNGLTDPKNSKHRIEKFRNRDLGNQTCYRAFSFVDGIGRLAGVIEYGIEAKRQWKDLQEFRRVGKRQGILNQLNLGRIGAYMDQLEKEKTNLKQFQSKLKPNDKEYKQCTQCLKEIEDLLRDFGIIEEAEANNSLKAHGQINQNRRAQVCNRVYFSRRVKTVGATIDYATRAGAFTYGFYQASKSGASGSTFINQCGKVSAHALKGVILSGIIDVIALPYRFGSLFYYIFRAIKSWKKISELKNRLRIINKQTLNDSELQKINEQIKHEIKKEISVQKIEIWAHFSRAIYHGLAGIFGVLKLLTMLGVSGLGAIICIKLLPSFWFLGAIATFLAVTWYGYRMLREHQRSQQREYYQVNWMIVQGLQDYATNKLVQLGSINLNDPNQRAEIAQHMEGKHTSRFEVWSHQIKQQETLLNKQKTLNEEQAIQKKDSIAKAKAEREREIRLLKQAIKQLEADPPKDKTLWTHPKHQWCQLLEPFFGSSGQVSTLGAVLETAEEYITASNPTTKLYDRVLTNGKDGAAANYLKNQLGFSAEQIKQIYNAGIDDHQSNTISNEEAKKQLIINPLTWNKVHNHFSKEDLKATKNQVRQRIQKREELLNKASIKNSQLKSSQLNENFPKLKPFYDFELIRTLISKLHPKDQKEITVKSFEETYTYGFKAMQQAIPVR